MYTVKQLSELAGVSVRTLHYYDEIDLLKPSVVGENSYRYYDQMALLRLQQILFFREMDLGLLQIKAILDDPAFDLISALRSHRHVLQGKMERLRALMSTIDGTIMHLVGEVEMSTPRLFMGFSDEKQKAYEQEIRENAPHWKIDESIQLWNSYTDEQKARIGLEGEAVYKDLLKAIGEDPQSAPVQAVLVRWHAHLRYFYEPTVEILRALGLMYNTHPDFIRNFQQLHPDLPSFLEKAIAHYCDVLEENMLMELSVKG